MNIPGLGARWRDLADSPALRTATAAGGCAGAALVALLDVKLAAGAPLLAGVLGATVMALRGPRPRPVPVPVRRARRR